MKAAVALVAIVAAGRLAVRPLLHAVAGSRTPEVFTGIALLLVLGVGWITQEAGLSMALGAFLAGWLRHLRVHQGGSGTSRSTASPETSR